MGTRPALQFIPNVYAPAKDNTDAIRHEKSEHALHSFQSYYTNILIWYFADQAGSSGNDSD